MEITEINSDILKLVIEFWSKGPRVLLTKPILTDQYIEEVREWELKFFEELSLDTVQELLIASSFLDNEVLTDAWSAFLAYQLKKTSIEKLENTYEVSTNLEEDQEDALMEKYQYLILKDADKYLEAVNN